MALWDTDAASRHQQSISSELAVNLLILRLLAAVSYMRGCVPGADIKSLEPDTAYGNAELTLTDMMSSIC